MNLIFKVLALGMVLTLHLWGGYYGSLALAVVAMFGFLSWIDERDRAMKGYLMLTERHQAIAEDLAQFIMDHEQIDTVHIVMLDAEKIEQAIQEWRDEDEN